MLLGVWPMIAVVGLTPADAVPQEVVQIRSTPSCARCSIQLHRITDIGDRDGPGMLSDDVQIAVTDSLIFVHDVLADRGSIQVFASSGRHVQRIGRAGRGPGEFVLPIALLPRPDGSLVVLDLAARRMTVLDPGLRVAQTTSIEAASALAAVLPDATIVVSASVPTRDRIGYPLHHLDASGRIVRSFGATDPQVLPGAGSGGLRRIAPASRGRVWAASIAELQVQLWNPATGAQELELRRDADWSPELRGAPRSRNAPAPSGQVRIAGIQEDQNGRLWLLAHIPDPNRAPVPRRNRPGGETTIDSADRSRMHDTVIEVWDIAAGQIVAQARFDQYLWLRGPGYVSHYAEKSDGTPFHRILRFDLTTRE